MADDKPQDRARRYHHAEVEPRWQRYWDEHETFRAVRRTAQRPKRYVLDMFPYPSGAGLHVGHPEGYTATDIVARYCAHARLRRAAPDGLGRVRPARRAARHRDRHAPARDDARRTSRPSSASSRCSGFSYDWSREIDTTDPDYVRWTQWIFLQLFEQGPRLPGRRSRSTGAPRSAPCSPTKRSSTARARAAATRSSASPLRQWMLQDHRVRRSARRGPRAARLARADDDQAAPLDRPQRGRRDRLRRRRPAATGADVRRSSRRAPTRCSA